MFFSKSFEAALDQLSNQIQIQIQDSTRDDYLDLSIQAWCDYLNFSMAEKSYIQQSIKNQKIYPRVSPDSLKSNDFQISLGGNKIKINTTAFISRLDERMQWRNHNMKFYLLFAFVIVSIGYVYFVFAKKYERQNFQSREGKLASSNNLYSASAQPVSPNFSLILVVNVKHEGIINALKHSGSITSDMAEQLYRSTQELWFGSEDQYSDSPIETSFKGEETPDPSEYDVYFIKIKLAQEISGFGENISQLSRRDGFMQLPTIAKDVKISNRLPSKSYANIGVYSR